MFEQTLVTIVTAIFGYGAVAASVERLRVAIEPRLKKLEERVDEQEARIHALKPANAYQASK